MAVSHIPLVTGTCIIAGAAFQALHKAQLICRPGCPSGGGSLSRVQMLGTSGESSVGVDIRSVAASDTGSGLI